MGDLGVDESRENMEVLKFSGASPASPRRFGGVRSRMDRTMLRTTATDPSRDSVCVT